MRPEGPKIKAEGRHRGEVLGEGQQAPSPQAKEFEERCELPSGVRGSPDRPNVFHYFQHSGWPLLTLKREKLASRCAVHA